MIGSMPFETADEAALLLAKYPLACPVWYQLPKRSFKETMIPQYCESFPGIRINEKEKKIWVEFSDDLMNDIGVFYEHFVNENLDAFSISPEHSQGIHYVLNQLKANGQRVPMAKGQVPGPFTFGLTLNDQNMKNVWFDPEYRDVVLKGLTMKALWQVRELQKYADNVIIFFDEPILSAFGTAAYMSIQDDDVITGLNEVIHAVQAKGGTVGIHCCGNMDWALLTKTDVDIIAFDAYYYGEKVALYPAEIKAFLKKGKYLAWGIVPTSGHTAEEVPLHEETAETLQQKLEDLLEIFIRKGIPEDLLRTQMILTPSCGMGTMSKDNAETVLRLLSELSK